MKIVEKLNKEAKGLEKQAATKFEEAKKATKEIIRLKAARETLLNEAEKLNNSAGKHYQAAEMLKGE